MFMYSTVYTEPTKPLLLEKIKEIIPECEITISETIIKISGISARKMSEIDQCFPFEAAKSDKHSKDKDYALTKEEKELLTAFFAESDYIITRDDYTGGVHLYSAKESEVFFDEKEFLFWEDNLNIQKEYIENKFKEANVDFETFLKIF